MAQPVSAEFALVLACCRWPLAPRDLERIVTAGRGVDWTGVVTLSARHRVEAMVWRALREAAVVPPAREGQALMRASAAIAGQNLAIAAESIKLRRSLEAAGLRPLFIKGVTLGKLAYGDIVRKAGWDIDLLIAPGDLEDAVRLLRARGYALRIPAGADAEHDLPRWHRLSKESVWQSADGAFWVELHTALTNHTELLPTITASSYRQEVEVSPGLSLPTLAFDTLIAYLFVHGASSAWFRLKWIADVAALLRPMAPDEIERLYHLSQTLGAGRAAAQALLLAGQLFEIALPAPLHADMARSRINRMLVAIALRKLSGRGGTAELDRVTLGTATIHLSQIALLPGWRYRRDAIARMLINPIDRMTSPLPPALRWLYPAVTLRRLLRARSSG